MKRVFVAAIHHESNSFNPIVAGEGDFAVLRGREIFENIRSNDSLSGLVTALQEAGYEVVPGLSARAVPNGLVDQDFYKSIKNEIVDRARKAHQEKPLDAIALALHGSMRVKDFGEAEGPLLEELRLLFPQIPLYASLDMHATMTRKMHDHCDGFVGYKTAPHIDCTETGRHAAQMVIRALEDGTRGKSAWVRVPILVAGEQSATSAQPMIGLIDCLRAEEAREGILAASYLMGFPWADNEDSAVGVYVVATDDQELADRTALRLAQTIWDQRNDFAFLTEAYHQEEALDKAFEALGQGLRPVLLSDSGDNPTAGAAADHTDFIRHILQDGRAEKLGETIIYGGFYDPKATRACKGKLGQEVRLAFGGAFDKEASQPIEARGVVKAYYENWGRYNFPKGDLALFSTGGLEIVLAEEHVGFTDPQMYRDLGLEPEKAAMIINKLGYLTPGHQEISQKDILVLTRGNTNEDLKSIEYKLVPRPIFPLDEDFEYDPQDHLIEKEVNQ